MGVPPEAIPLWVADMDFPVMPEVTAAINRRTAHEIYGYSLPADSYFESIQGWMLRRHHWATEKEWILTVPGVVQRSLLSMPLLIPAMLFSFNRRYIPLANSVWAMAAINKIPSSLRWRLCNRSSGFRDQD